MADWFIRDDCSIDHDHAANILYNIRSYSYANWGVHNIATYL